MMKFSHSYTYVPVYILLAVYFLFNTCRNIIVDYWFLILQDTTVHGSKNSFFVVLSPRTFINPPLLKLEATKWFGLSSKNVNTANKIFEFLQLTTALYIHIDINNLNP